MLWKLFQSFNDEETNKSIFSIASCFALTTISINPHRHARRNKWSDHCLMLLMMVKRVFSRMSEKHKSLYDDTNWFKSEVNGLVLCAVLAEQCLHKFVLPSSIKCLNICPLEGGWLNWWRLFKLQRNKDGQGELPTHKTTIVRSTRRCLPKLSRQTMKGDNSTPEAMAKENVLTLCGSECGRERRQMRCRAECWKPDPWQRKCQKAKTISTYWVPFGICGWEIFIKTI